MSNLDPSICKPVPTAPMPMLAALQKAVLTRSPKRMPIWRSRLVPDIIMQIQPRPTYLPIFERRALVYGNATATFYDSNGY